MSEPQSSQLKSRSQLFVLTIDRKRWLNGTVLKSLKQNAGWSRLYRSEDRRQCCLGFYARQCGLKVNDIREIAMPREVRDLWPTNHAPLESPIWTQLAEVNDRPNSRGREATVKKLFKSIGIRVEFIN